ncbi:MAG TPA: cytochrome c [Flavobacteriaceae bacterium]|nr:cytochrome c [Flavobacteriaceae bacterium]
MKKLITILTVVLASTTLVSCFDSSKPNYQFMDEMYRSQSYDTYGEYNIFPNQQQAMLPAEGTIPRGWMPYEYEDTPDGLARARQELKNPLPVTEANLASGKHMYTVNCAVCHGDKGDGQGILPQREKFLGVPSFDDQGRVLTSGSIYHVIMYGMNAMGSYASQTSEQERWQIVMYVENLKASLKGEDPLPMADDLAQFEADKMDAELSMANESEDDNISEESEE